MAYSARELLARILKCEDGGEGENGMKAVASVIMNRVNVPNGKYLTGSGELAQIVWGLATPPSTEDTQSNCPVWNITFLTSPWHIYLRTPFKKIINKHLKVPLMYLHFMFLIWALYKS